MNEYFKEDAVAHREELLTETYQLTDTSSELPFPIGLVSLCNDAVRKEKIKGQDFYKDLADKKRYPAYPAVKIARLGIHIDFQNVNMGRHMINLIKRMFLDDNRTGCRLLTVDAYNNENEKVVNFYKKNDFQFFNNKDATRQTRAMFFDLKRLSLHLK
ncbi:MULTISPECIES: hypothetical protein [Desulfobacula]|uniref:Conserved uncharacterized protein n=1 Tax=Desulfobacula toluolica (strain DSM 7467 / Tol2) TaxID=651182 RepID=K0NK44_DESTT|nr:MULTISPECIES: hypothetical protein [Desulfobacula]CCK81235.1 conserved uncharacterized protein [Desulfobacula toluolica Tol2]